jgi:hypothetical protein
MQAVEVSGHDCSHFQFPTSESFEIVPQPPIAFQGVSKSLGPMVPMYDEIPMERAAKSVLTETTVVLHFFSMDQILFCGYGF